MNRKVFLFVPCFVDQFFPEIAENTFLILKNLGFQVIINKKQTCCGQPAFNAGYKKETRKLAKKFIKDFEGEYLIVSPVASCPGFIKKHYHKLFETSDYFWQNKVKNLKKRIFELSDFIVNYLKISKLETQPFPYKITYHDSCTALREYGIKKEPRILLSNVEGLNIIEMKEAETCCGFGGTFSVKLPHISSAIVKKKIESALETGAEYLVSTEASCLLNIKGYIDKNKIPLKAIHLTEILKPNEKA